MCAYNPYNCYRDHDYTMYWIWGPIGFVILITVLSVVIRIIWRRRYRRDLIIVNRRNKRRRDSSSEKKKKTNITVNSQAPQ